MNTPSKYICHRLLRAVSLCSGIGGIDLAMEMVGGYEIVGQVEIDPFCRAVLAKHWPTVRRLEDVREVRGDEFGAVDIITAGFPCQPSSLAGKRRGRSDDRWLWPEIARVVRTARPQWLVLENVVGLLSVDAGGGFTEVLRDLAALGYRAGWGVWGAADVGAPHRRERVFIVGFNTSHALADTQSGEREWSGPAWTGSAGLADRRAVVADADSSGRGSDERHLHAWQPNSARGSMADSHGGQCEQWTQLPGEWREVPPDGNVWPDAGGRGDDEPCDALANPDGDRRGDGAHQPQSGDTCCRPTNTCTGGTDATGIAVGASVADANGAGRQEQHVATVTARSGYAAGRSVTNVGATSRPTDGITGSDLRENAIEPGMGGTIDGFPGWLDGHRWPAGPTEAQSDWEAPRVLPRNQHKSNRNARLKALGNAVVPQQIAPLLAAIAAIEGETEGRWSP